MVNTEYYRGGAAQIARKLHDALNATPEHQSCFTYGKGSKANSREAIRFAWQPEVYLHAFLTRATGLQGYGTWLSTKRLIKFIIREKLDIIHLHNLHGYYLDLRFIKLISKLNIPVVWTLHDGWPLTGRCAYLFECDRWKTGCGSCPNLPWYPKTYLDTSALMWKRKKEHFTQGWNPVIVCPSKWLADRVKESYLKKYDIVVIPNAVDTKIFKPRNKDSVRKKLGISSREKVILFVASDLNDERKGTRFFLKALKFIKDKDILVLTMGKKINFPEEAKASISVRQLGYIIDKEIMSDTYNIADIFCITSLDEVFGLTITESMSCGIPVVGFNVGGIPEQVTEDCGIMVEPKDVNALAKAIEKLLNDEKMKKNFSENCRKRVLQNYTIDKFTDSYIKVYNKILRGIK